MEEESPEVELRFFYECGPVGVFVGPDWPSLPGIHKYMPFRSGSHYAMWGNVASKGVAHCSFDSGSGEMLFTVVGTPGYGEIEISEISLSTSN